MDADAPFVLESAGRHGVSASDAVHAWALAVDAWDVGDGLVMYIGPARSGDLLEVGVVDWHGHIAIVHAMRARPKFLR
jgi:hypothetical protein